MKTTDEAAITYRLIVTRRNASEILLIPAGTAWITPRVEIHTHKRVAEQLTAKVSRSWGVDAYCLLAPSFSTRGRDGEPCAVMESVCQNDEAPAGTFWVPRITAEGGVESTESGQIRQSLDELDGYATNRKAGPLATPGWLRELCGWVEDQLAPFGLRLTGGFRQLNASPTFSLIRLDTDRDAVWFKATGEPNCHELSLTTTLARHFPGYVPTILGVHKAWNGWLSGEVAGVSLGEIAGFSPWERAAEDLAELQIASIGKLAELLEVQFRDLRVPRLAERIDPFLTGMKDLMAVQEKPVPAPLVESELAMLAERLKETCKLLESIGLSNTLGHIDLNPGNILVSENRCVFLDWAEGCIAHPFITFEYLLEHMARTGIEEPAASDRLVAAYLRPWACFYSPEDMRQAVAVAPLLAVFAYAVANDSWRSVDVGKNPSLAAYFRSLTRRMYREAIRVGKGSEVCVS